MSKLIITIDGTASSGKGTVSQQLGRELSIPVLPTGLIYRALSYIAKDCNLSPSNVAELDQFTVAFAANATFTFDNKTHGKNFVVKFKNYSLTEADLLSNEIGLLTSEFSKIPVLRRNLVSLQQELMKNGGIAEGRDMGTVIFPNAQLKIFLTASLNERAKRRYLQLYDPDQINQIDEKKLAILTQDLYNRDYQDINRSVSTTLPASDSFNIDSTKLNPTEIVHLIIGQLKNKKLLDFDNVTK